MISVIYTMKGNRGSTYSVKKSFNNNNHRQAYERKISHLIVGMLDIKQ